MYSDQIGWYIGISGVIVSLVGGIFFLKSSAALTGRLKKSINYLVAASLLYVLFSSIMVFFGIMQRNIQDPWWQLIPLLYFVSSVFFVIGSISLVRIVRLVKVFIK